MNVGLVVADVGLCVFNERRRKSRLVGVEIKTKFGGE